MFSFINIIQRNMNTILKLSNVSKNYPGFHLSNINLEIEKGSIVGLVGENGAGKTTLISMILNQRKIDSGYIEVFGKSYAKNDLEMKQEIGFYNDECCFHPCFTALDIGKIMKSIYINWDISQYKDYLSSFKVPLNKKIDAMSKGTKSKLMLATTMAYNPSLLIFDEITSGLDPIVRVSILKIIKDYVETHGATAFFSTHITSDLENMADEVIFLHNGEIVFREKVVDLHNNYVIYEGDANDFQSVRKENIIRSWFSGERYILLVSSDNKLENIGNNSRRPNIEDIMHLFIEGEGNNDRIN